MRIRQYTLVFIWSIIIALPAAAATKEENRVADATDVLDQFLRIPEQSIPPALLSRAYGVAVIPSVIKIGFGLGARRGKGILVVRQKDGSWSNPAFVTLTGGSFGFQVGAQSTDIILVFKTRKSIDGIANGKLGLGADAAVAAGPVGRSTGVATDIKFRAEVYSYSRSRGLFAGVSLEGSGMTMDRKANAAYYSSASITPEQIFAGSGGVAPETAVTFLQVLTEQTDRLPMRPGMKRSVASTKNTSAAPQQQTEVRTYGYGTADDALDSGTL